MKRLEKGQIYKKEECTRIIVAVNRDASERHRHCFDYILIEEHRKPTRINRVNMMAMRAVLQEKYLC